MRGVLLLMALSASFCTAQVIPVTPCLVPDNGCNLAENGIMNLDWCDITDDQVEAGYLATCFEAVGPQNIRILDLGGNDLTTLPSGTFDTLTELQELDLGFNDLTTLPSGTFDTLTKLQELNLGWNDLTTLPPDIFSPLTTLTYLDLETNDLTTLPSGLFDTLTELQELHLASNSVSTPPPDIFSPLTKLTYLDLDGNDLTTLPSGLFDTLTELQELSAYDIGLTTLPSGIFDSLRKLQRLDLDVNHLATLPSEVFDSLTQLQILDLSSNDLGTLPSGIFDSLTALTRLDLASNDLGTLPSGIFDSLTALTHLSLTGSSLTTLPSGIFDPLPELTHLHLASNDFTSLPSGIFDSQRNLIYLRISSLDLDTLPSGIFDSLTELETLYLNNNGLTSLPLGIFDSLTQLQYLWLYDNPDLECVPTVTPSITFLSVDDTVDTVHTCDGSDFIRGDPHMKGLRGQRIDWSGVNGGWYSLIKDDNAELNINIRLTAPLPDEFPDRQLVTGLTVMSKGHSLVIEVGNPYAVDTDGCPDGISPCLANGGLRITVDGEEHDELLRFSRQVPVVADDAISISASNLPAECRQFGGDKIWARKYQEFLEGGRKLRANEGLEDWILTFDHHMAAPGWCAKYIAENDLADLQSTHAIFKIETPTVTVRLNAGVNHQGDGELDWDGRALPDLEFWQMDVGLDGLDIENPALSGILGETARPVYDENGKEVMEGFEAFRGTVEDYCVSGALGVHFALLD